MALQTGELLHGRYRIVRAIKQGGMGAVYEAADTKLANSPCAVKEISDEARAGNDCDYIESRFFEEMKALANLDHPCIPRLRDFFRENSVVYLVMDLVRGRNLEEELNQREPLDPELVVRDMICLLETLSYLHGQHPPIIHRDVKPANLLRDERTGAIKLVDFGLARELTSANHTAVGTLGYCPPEQMMGQAVVGSDLFSVGVTLCQLLTRQPPDLACFEPLRPDLPHLRPGLAEIIEKATHLKPAHRYCSADEMAEALRAWLEGRHPLFRRVQEVVEVEPLSKASGGGKGLAVAAILALSLGLWSFQPSPSAGAAERPAAGATVRDGSESVRSASGSSGSVVLGSVSSGSVAAGSVLSGSAVSGSVSSGRVTAESVASGSEKRAGSASSESSGRDRALQSKDLSANARSRFPAHAEAPVAYPPSVSPPLGDSRSSTVHRRPRLGGGPLYPTREPSRSTPDAVASGAPDAVTELDVPSRWEPARDMPQRRALDRIRESRQNAIREHTPPPFFRR